MSRPRVLYVVEDCPPISHTYVENEIAAVEGDFEVFMVARNPAILPCRTRTPHVHAPGRPPIREVIRTFRPAVVHTHYLTMVGLVSALCRESGLPFTVRAHSSDCLRSIEGERHVRSQRAGGRSRAAEGWSLRGSLRRLYRRLTRPARNLRAQVAPLVNDDHCLGVLSFPFTRPILEAAGIREDKIRDCYPVVAYDRFHDRSPNGHDVMNVGAYQPKKRMEDFLRLARMAPGPRFDLYLTGPDAERLDELNRRLGEPVHLRAPIEPAAMPAEYKRHRWLVYTACPRRAGVGWPMAVAEAQAAGVGVCMANVRPDLRDYVGDAGFLFDTLADVKRIIEGPFPDEMRERGFELARRSDIGAHRVLLTELWQRAAGAGPGATER